MKILRLLLRARTHLKSSFFDPFSRLTRIHAFFRTCSLIGALPSTRYANANSILKFYFYVSNVFTLRYAYKITRKMQQTL